MRAIQIAFVGLLAATAAAAGRAFLDPQVGGQVRYSSGMLDWAQCAAVERVAGRVSGAWLFKSTRVPVKALFENLEDGARVDDFLDWFPGVTREQVEAVLQHAELSLAEA